jgi:hypothetical protein
MDALEKLRQEFFAVVRENPEERWDALTKQVDAMLNTVKQDALRGLAAEATELRERASASASQEGVPGGLLFGLPTILAWRVAGHVAAAAQATAQARQPESVEAGYDEEADIYRALWLAPDRGPCF